MVLIFTEHKIKNTFQAPFLQPRTPQLTQKEKKGINMP